MNFRRIWMPITHHTPEARVSVVKQCLGLNQVVEGGIGGIAKGVCIKPAKSLLVVIAALRPMKP